MTNVASNIAMKTKKNSSFLCQINCMYSVKVRGLKLGMVDSLAFRAGRAGWHRHNRAGCLRIVSKLFL
jgi:hypothetical protein